MDFKKQAVSRRGSNLFFLLILRTENYGNYNFSSPKLWQLQFMKEKIMATTKKKK